MVVDRQRDMLNEQTNEILSNTTIIEKQTAEIDDLDSKIKAMREQYLTMKKKLEDELEEDKIQIKTLKLEAKKMQGDHDETVAKFKTQIQQQQEQIEEKDEKLKLVNEEKEAL